MMQHSETGAQHLGILWTLMLDGPLPTGPEARVPATFTRVGPEVVQELAEAMGLDDGMVLQRFARGRHCYIARVEGKLVTYGWVTFDEEGIGEIGLRIRLKAGEAYVWDCATLPVYRGLRLYPALLLHILGELYAAGLRRVWIGTDADNLPSQVGVALVGFLPVADVMLTRVLAVRRPWVRGRPGVPEQDVMDVRYALFGDSARLAVLPPVEYD